MSLPDPREKPTLSVIEVSEILGWGRSAVYEGVRRGDIPSLRVGRRIRVPTARLHDLLGIAENPKSEPPLPTQNETAETPSGLSELLAEVIARGIELAHERGHILCRIRRRSLCPLTALRDADSHCRDARGSGALDVRPSAPGAWSVRFSVMNLQVDWGKPIPMRRAHSLAYELDLDRLPDEAGVYVFGRSWGGKFEALYVGKALRIRRRVKGQTNNLRLMTHVRDAQTGKRVVIPGVIKTRPGQQIEKAMTLVERALIRHFLSEGHDLVNISGATLRRHELVSTHRPMRFVPPVMYLDKDR